MTINTGSDYSTFRDDGTYGLTYVRITGARVPLEGVARLWLTDRGSLFWAPTLGFNVARLENASQKRAVLAQYESFLVKAAREVDFVAAASVAITFSGTTLTAAGRITLVDGVTYPLLVTAADAAVVTVRFPSSPLA